MPDPKPTITVTEQQQSPVEMTLHPEEEDTELDKEVEMLNKKLLEDENKEDNKTEISTTNTNEY